MIPPRPPLRAALASLFASAWFLLLSFPASALAQSQDWRPLNVPGVWENAEDAALKSYDGFAWYRCAARIPADFDGDGDPLTLAIEQVDNAYEAYFNGVKIGGAGAFPPSYRGGLAEPKRLEVPRDKVRWGRLNFVAIRVYDREGRGGFKGRAPYLIGGGRGLELKGPWQFRTGDDLAWASEELPPGVSEYFHVVAASFLETSKPPIEGLREPSTPDVSLKKLKIADDLEVRQLLAEPIVAQPLQLSFDERGRLWVAEYRQYPHPAGLKLLSRDKFWRAHYDKVPDPPPHHVKGKDRISIHEDRDGDGTFETHKVFIDGLNIATSAAVGRGGVWVLNPPYLLFYPDRDRDDVPDSDPEVVLSGFGMEDTHSVANSLRFGPDGWLYAAQGSTVTGAVKRYGSNDPPTHSMGQLIWRYHPETRKYEIFSEGGGNAFGVEIDAQGRIFSGHNGGDTRGFHYMQGAYLQKGFGKHGPLSNPHAFGYFAPMAHHSVPRFTHTFLIYDGAGLPDRYRGQLLGVEPLQGQVVLSGLAPDRSTFKTKDLLRPMTSDDKWFRPVDIKQAPGGGVVVADWYDNVVNHYLNHEGNVHPENGRVYLLRAKGAPAPKIGDLAASPSAELVAHLSSPDKWLRQTALRLLGDRKDASVIPALRAILDREQGQTALEALWALNLCGGLNDEGAAQALRHSHPHVRSWAARLACDDGGVSSALAVRLAEAAKTEPNVETRAQLASSAKRLPAQAALAIVSALVQRSEDVDDPRLPLLIWWAIESKAGKDRSLVLDWATDRERMALPIVKTHLLDRLIKRWAMEGTRADLLACADLLKAATEPALAKTLVNGFEQALQGRSLASMPTELSEALNRAGGGSLALRVRLGRDEAIRDAIRSIADAQAKTKTPQAERLELIRALSESGRTQALAPLLGAARSDQDDRVRLEVLTALSRFNDPQVASTVIELHNGLAAELRTAAQNLLVSRKIWAKALMEAIDAGRIDSKAIDLDAVRKLTIHKDDALSAAVRKRWPSLEGVATETMRNQIVKLSAAVRRGQGEPYAGKALFVKSCGQCHQLFGQGGRVGPDLTTYQRDDFENMLLNIINPSAEVREGFGAAVVVTEDGRVANGIVVEEDAKVVVLRDSNGQDSAIQRSEIQEMAQQAKSLMPEGLMDHLSEQQVRDLFAYLRSTQPLNE